MYECGHQFLDCHMFIDNRMLAKQTNCSILLPLVAHCSKKILTDYGLSG